MSENVYTLLFVKIIKKVNIEEVENYHVIKIVGIINIFEVS